MTDEAPVAEAEAPAPNTAPEAPPETETVEETVSMPRAEADALRRKLAESERERRKLADDQKKAAEQRQAEQGQFKDLAEKREQELTAERAERARAEREQRITRLAGKAKFVDPADVIGRISADEGVDDQSVEAALERIAGQSPHLVAKEAPVAPEIGQVLTPSATPQAGTPQPPPGKAPLRSIADIEALSDKEFDDRFAEVQAVLKGTQ